MKTFITLFFGFLIYQSHGQTTFQKTYKNANLIERGNGYCISSDGKYMVAGEHYDIFGVSPNSTLMKLDISGNVVWRKIYPGIDGFTSIAQTQDNGFIIAGYSDSLVNGDVDMFILKIDSSGTPLWSSHLAMVNSIDISSNIVQTPDKGFLLTGNGSNSFTSAQSAFIVKMDSLGNLVWDKIIPGELNNISVLNDGSLIISGFNIMNNEPKLLIIKLDATGTIMWTRVYLDIYYGGPCRQTTDGGLICTGVGQSSTISNGCVLLKSDSLGDFQWCKVFSNVYSTPGLILNNDGDFVIAGTYQSASDSARILLIKTNNSGDTIWTRFYQPDPLFGYKGESTNRILLAADGGFFVGGQADVEATTLSEIYLLKTDANGNAGCNVVHREITSESITPTYVTSITPTSGITINSFMPPVVNSQITDTTLCFFDLIRENKTKLPLEVYPNPAQDYIQIITSTFAETEFLLEINDILGRTIIQKKITGVYSVKVDVSSLTNGMYVISMTGKHEIGKKIFFKQ